MSGGSTVARVSAGVAGGAVLISVITIAARATGILRQLTFTRTVGLTCLNSVYTTANTVPNIVFEVVAGGALSAAVVPAVAASVERGDRAATARTVSALLSWTFLLLVPVTLLGYLLTGPVIRALLGSGGVGLLEPAGADGELCRADASGVPAADPLVWRRGRACRSPQRAPPVLRAGPRAAGVERRRDRRLSDLRGARRRPCRVARRPHGHRARRRGMGDDARGRRDAPDAAARDASARARAAADPALPRRGRPPGPWTRDRGGPRRRRAASEHRCGRPAREHPGQRRRAGDLDRCVDSVSAALGGACGALGDQRLPSTLGSAHRR